MRQEIVTGGKREKQAGGCSGFDLLFLLAAVYGLVFLACSIEGLQFRLGVVLIGAPLPGFLLWCLKRKGKVKWAWACFTVFFLACLLSLGIGELREQVHTLLSAFVGRADGAEQDVTGGLLALAGIAALLLFLLELVFHLHWPLYLLTTLMLLAAPFFGTAPGIPSVFLFFAFQIAFWIMNGMSKQGRKHLFSNRRGFRNHSVQAAGAVILAGVFLLSMLVVNGNATWFYQAAYSAEEFLQRTVKQLSGAASNPNDGTVNRGNLYPAGMEQLELRTDREPTETIYLRGFSGGDYSDGEWQAADDESIFERMEENTLHWGRWSDWIPGLYNSMYFVMNANMLRAELPQERELWIEQRENIREQWYTPYFSMWNWRGTGEAGNVENSYHYRYYEMDEMKIDWDAVAIGFETNRDWYYEVQEAYRREIAAAYTAVPEETLPRLTRFCAENPVESPEQATLLILSVLQSSAVYTRTPGLFPLNEDPVEYFLFEGQAGYCQHFASAAVLMYRLYGIPARYATGYAVSPSDFTRQEDGSYLAVVTDESAHAWPEIFMTDYGWVPIEVTPAGNDTVSTYPGMDRNLLEDLLSVQNENLELPQHQANAENEFGEPSASALSVSFIVRLPDFWLWFVVDMLFLAFAFFWAFRAARLRAIDVMDVRRLFSRMVEALQFSGLLQGYGGSEEELVLHLSEIIPGFTETQARLLLRLLREASFGGAPITEGQETEVRRIYRQIVRAAYQKLPFWKKPVFKYAKMFL